MKYTYDLNTTGCLIITASPQEQEMIRKLANPETGEFNSKAECEALESLLANSDLCWIDPSETGDLTDAPMLGIRNEDGTVFARWAFMDYQVRSFLTDLLEHGKAVFIS